MLEEYLLTSIPHPVKSQLTHLHNSYVQIAQDKLNVERMLNLEIFQHQQTKHALKDVSRQLESCQQQLELHK